MKLANKRKNKINNNSLYYNNKIAIFIVKQI